MRSHESGYSGGQVVTAGRAPDTGKIPGPKGAAGAGGGMFFF